MANFFTRALDKLTPWNRGGEVQRRQEKKKREEEEAQRQVSNQSGGLRVGPAQPTQNIVVAGQQPKPQAPVNIFETLNKNLTLGKPNSVVPVFNNANTEVAPKPQPGQVVQPTVKVTPTRTQGITLPDGRNTRDIPDTNEMIVNRGMDRGKSFEDIARENNLDVSSVREYAKVARPDYGIKLERPKQGFGNRIRDIFDTNTESDKFRRQEGNKVALAKGNENDVKSLTLERQGNIVSRTPIVGHVVKAGNTLFNQAGQLANITLADQAQREFNAANEEWQKVKNSGDRDKVIAALDRVDKAQQRIDFFKTEEDAGYSRFKKNDGGLLNAGTLYDEEGSRKGDIGTGVKDVVLPTVVTMADVYTLGKGSAVTEGLKQTGKAGLRTQLPNIVKLSAGNYVSGDLGARAEGATGWDPVVSGGTNVALGAVPDIGLPIVGRSLKNRVIPRIMAGRSVNPTDILEEVDDAALSASAETANQAMRPRPISIAQDIPVGGPEGLISPVRVRNLNEPGRLIQEVTGDATTATPNPLIQATADEARATAMRDAAFDQAKTAPKPNPAIEGILPGQPTKPFTLTPEVVKSVQDDVVDQYAAFLRDVGEGNGTQLVPDGEGGYFRTSNNVRMGDTAGKRMTKAAWREEAERQLKAGQADPALQKVFDEAADPEVQALLSKGEQAPVQEGRPITVKQANSIPVTDETVIPTGLPETPGTVRATVQSSPMAAKTQAAANAPVVASPAQLPAEVQAVLDNPKQFNKRQVAAARNQRKLARQMAKTQEDTVEALERIEGTKPPTTAQPEGYAPTGRFARGEKGNVYQKASAGTEAVAGQTEMAARSVDDLLDEIGTKESFTPGDRRRIAAALENVAKANPDDKETRMILKKLQSKSRTELAQGLAMWPRIVRRSASADTLTGRWESKLSRALEDPSKLTDEAWSRVQKANDNFTLARDRAAQLEEQFKKTGSESDFKAWEDAHKAARQADTDAKFTEADVARKTLRGEKGAAVNKVIDDLKKEADVNTMDSITASMLSGTATGFRNTFGTELAGVENRLFANTRAKITNKLFGQNVGGFDRKSARLGRKVGIVKLGRDAARRAEIGGKNPIEWAKNWSTTINSGGESSLQSQVYSRLGKYYKNQFAEQGLSGKELDMRMRHALLTDPDGIGNTFMDAAMKSSGLTGIFQKSQSIEKAVTDWVGKGTDSKTAQAASKLVMRIAVGFPTATGNFIAQSGKRLTLGLPSYLETGFKLANGDKMGAALAFERGLKETGSGLGMVGLGAALGSQGLITGPYPDDPEERARWERDGISENSINIGGNWFPIPQGAGMLGLPLMFGAAIGREGDSNESVKELFTPKNLSELLPTDQIQGFLNMASGNGAPQDLKNTIASGVRAVTPAGSLINQISKSLDETKNDTTSKDFWGNVFDAVGGSNPVTNSIMDIPDKTDDAGNPISNPNPLALAFGATSTSQSKGIERSGQIQAKIEGAAKNLQDAGILDDENLAGVLDDKQKLIYDKLMAGKKVDEKDIKQLQEAFVKGVSTTGEDTAYLEREQYDTNLKALRLKKQLMEADKTVKPSDLKSMDLAIKRGEVYKEAKVPYEMIDTYKSIGVDEWRKMGIPPGDDDYDEEYYNPEMYQKLWDLDQMMTKAGVSYRKGALDKNKYFVKEKKGGSGSGGRRGDTFTAEFGQLKAGSFAPEVRAYQSIDEKSGSVPIIRTVRPNIVHKIGSSGRI